MDEIACDVAVIGAGTAGIAAHRAALEAGANSILIEQGPGGTTCARVGCMPSKLLITAATAAFDARSAAAFGIEVGDVRVDGPAVLGRVRTVRDDLVGSVFRGLDALPAESRIEGRAVFEGPLALVVDDRVRVRFRAAVLATGSSPAIPEPLEAIRDRVLTTDTVFELEDLPESLAVLGGGPLGLELAQAFARLGVKTTLFDPAPKLGGLADPDLCAAAREIFGEEIELRLGAEIEKADPAEVGATLYWSDGDGRSGRGRFEGVLAAAGRPPNVRGIGLDRTGVDCDGKGIPIFDPLSLACDSAAIFVAGDVNQDRPVLHEASRQGEISGRNAARLACGAAPERPERWVNLAIAFTHPQIAVVGRPFDAGATSDWLIGRTSFCDQGRARAMARDSGGLKVYADRSGLLIGAEMIGPDVEHLAQVLAYAIQDGHTAQAFLDRPFYHPTVEEGLKTALSEIARQVVD